MNKKYLIPIQIEFIHWLRREYLDTKYEIRGREYLQEILDQGWYKADDADWFNNAVDIYKEEWLSRNNK